MTSKPFLVSESLHPIRALLPRGAMRVSFIEEFANNFSKTNVIARRGEVVFAGSKAKLFRGVVCFFTNGEDVVPGRYLCVWVGGV